MIELVIAIKVSVDEQVFDTMLNTMQPLQTLVNIVSPGITLYGLLNIVFDSQTGNGPLRILETGCLRDGRESAWMPDGWSSYYFAKWVKEHPGSTLMTVDIDRKALNICQETLSKYGLYTNTWKADSLTAIAEWVPADVYFLDSCDGLDHGLAEFRAAILRKPKMIIMDDFDTKASKAYDFAIENKIPVSRIDRYTVFDLQRLQS